MPLSFRRASLALAFREPHAPPRTNLFVAVDDDAGLAGIGEGCPPDIAHANALSDLHAGALARVDTLDALRAWMLLNAAAIDAAPAAFCAVELALLDL